MNKPKLTMSFLTIYLMLLSNANASVTIINPSFEADILADGTWIRSATGWEVTGGGIFNPYVNSLPQENVPEGNNIAWINNGSFYQKLSSTLLENTTYSLSVDIVERLDTNINDYLIQLIAGNTVIAEDNNSIDPGNGNFLVSTISYNSTIGDLLSGNQLAIRLSSNSQQFGFDNIRLNTSTVSSVPVPGALWLFCSGLLGLFRIRTFK